MNFREKLEKRLEAGKFRILNERLQKKPGTIPGKDVFLTYHHGFRRQARKWPEKPLEIIKAKLRKDEVVVDMGCGEAELAKEFPFAVSLDLCPVNGRAIQSDMRRAPICDGKADAVVFCLSLMFPDASLAIREGNRVLQRGGRLLVAEVLSRVGDPGEFVQKIESLGFQALEWRSNGYFVFAELEKVEEAKNLCEILLKPSVYRKR